jgi:hypothetical protein
VPRARPSSRKLIASDELDVGPEGEVTTDIYAFLTTEPNAEVARSIP